MVRMSRRLSGLATGLLCGSVVVATLALPPAVASAEASPPSPSAQADKAKPKPPRRTIRGTLGKVPDLSLAGQLISGARPGGRGIFDVVLASTTPGGKSIRGLETRIEAPRGTTLTRVSGKDWKCTIAPGRRAADCSLTRTLGRDETAPHVRAHLAVSSSYAASKAWITGYARWDGAERDEGNWVLSERNDLPVYPKATLTVTPSAPKVTVFRNGGSDQRRFQLLAEIGRLQGQHAELTWRQVSGPPVTFLTPTEVEGVADTAEQLIEVRQMPQRQRYVFEARVEAQGQVVKRQVSVVVLGATLLEEVGAAAPSEAAIAESTELAPLEGAERIKTTHDLRIAGPGLGAAGSTVTMRVAGKDAALGTPRWSIDGRAVGSGNSVRVVAPKTPGDTRLVEVTVTLKSGVIVQAARVLVAQAPDRSVNARGGIVTPRAPSGFCQLATSIKKKQADGDTGNRVVPLGAKEEQRFTFAYDKAKIGEGVFDGSGACSGSGEITITGATASQSSSVRLANVTATLSASGLVVSSARMTVNATVSNGLTDKLGLDLTGTVSSRLSGDVFSVLTGSAVFVPVAIDGAPAVSPFSLFLDEPEGWEFPADASQVNFESDLTLRLSQLATSPPNAQGTKAEASIAIDVLGDEPTKAAVTVANLTLGETPQGGLIMVTNGSASIDFTGGKGQKKASVNLPISCAGGWDSEACQLFTGFRFGSMNLSWTQSQMSLTAEAAIAYGGSKAYALTFEGNYRKDRDWDITVSNPKPWDLGQGMTFADLKGSVTSKPNGTGADVTMSITGTFSGLSLGNAVKVSGITPKLTNECPADTLERPVGAPECSLSEIKLFVDAKMEATLPGSTSPATFAARADINLTTLDFRFESGVSDLNVGPDALKLKDVRVIVGNGIETTCTPKGTAPAKPTGTVVRFVGNAEVLGTGYELNVQSDSRGLCIWGSGDTIALGGGLEAVTPLFAYTTFTKGASLVGADDIEPNRIELQGGFIFPASFKERFQIPGEGVTFKAGLSTDLTKANFAVQYNAAGEITLYRGAGADITLGALGFGLDLTMPTGGSPTFDAYFFGDGTLNIQGTPASSTKVEVRIGVSYSGAQFKIQLQGGVPSGETANAFGVDGLTVRALSLSAAIDLVSTTPSVALNADVTLPPGWTSSIGIADGTPVALAANLDALAPCLEFRMGQEGGANVVDLGGIGFLTANYFRLLLAPAGCQVPDGRSVKTIAAGWGFALHGALLGSPVQVSSEFGVTPEGVTVNAVLDLPQLDLYGVAFRDFAGAGGPKVTLDMNTASGKFDATLDASLEIGNVSLGRGLRVAVRGDISLKADRFTVNLNGAGATKLGPVGLSFNPVTLVANIPRPGQAGADNVLSVNVNTTVKATLDLGALGDYSIDASGQLQVQGYSVVRLSLKAAGNFDAKVYEVKGTIALDLCTGTLSALSADGGGSECTLFAADKLATSSAAVRVSAYGTQKWALKDPKPFAKAFYDKPGVER